MWAYANQAGGVALLSRSIGGSTLSLQSGQGSKFGTSITPDSPMRITIYRGTTFLGILKAVGRTGDVLNLDGSADGYPDFAVQANDKVGNVPAGGDFADLWANASELADELADLTTVVDAKANASDITALDTRLDNVETGKADLSVTNALDSRLDDAETDVDGLISLVAGKADTSALIAGLAGKENALPGGGTTSLFLRGDKTWATPPSADLSGYVTTSTYTAGLSGKQNSLPGGGSSSNYLRGDLTWTALPATTITSLINAGSGISLSGSGTAGVPYIISADFTGFVSTSTYTAGLAGKEPTITAGTTAQYLRGDKSLATFATDVIAALPSQTSNSGKFLTTNGSVPSWGTPAKSIVHLGRWATPTGSATTTGNIDDRNIAAPVACVPLTVYLSATVNTTGASVQVKVNGVDLFASPVTLAGGTTAPTAFTTFAVSSISAGHVVKPTITSIGSDVRGLVVDVWARES